ncbi:predicted protein [Nematostella vectensis]|uniref:CBM21 domain-containing protein n=2 Tax=Nematostella vectensis TaxID=45351 RepID=A7S413_NEMVE|nr:predicted protein [Nematostella vectensis]|eukprot:XP_001633692.1 predicted protein [Nematostella vectensis]
MTKRELQKYQKILNICFSQPVALEGFKLRLENEFVCMENASTSRNTIMGTIKVKNISYHKEVLVRYTLDSWHSFTDVPASYVLDSFDGNSDRFSFAVTIPEYFMASGGNIDFAICFRADGKEFWDNNSGQNYKVECRDDGSKMAGPSVNGF